MKKIITMLCLIALITGANAQETIPDSFWGIKFGLSEDAVKTAMLSKQGVTYGEKQKDVVQFKAKEFAGETCDGIICFFVDNKFYRAVVFVRPVSESKIFDLFRSVKLMMINKYGDPTLHAESFKSPYYDGDGYELQAVKKDKTNFYSRWNNQTNTIDLTITKSVSLILDYTDVPLLDIANKKKRAANSNDL